VNPNGQDATPYDRLVTSFSNPFVTAFYVLALILLGIQVRHGVRSAAQTLGGSSRRGGRAIDAFAILLSTVLIAGFLIVPFAVIYGFVD
jgi:succinate dehydrogenase / fumarate reductase cytochrome b subunit